MSIPFCLGPWSRIRYYCQIPCCLDLGFKFPTVWTLLSNFLLFGRFVRFSTVWGIVVKSRCLDLSVKFPTVWDPGVKFPMSGTLLFYYLLLGFEN